MNALRRNRFSRPMACLALAAWAVAVAPPARAVNCTGTTTAADFGSYDVFAAAADTTTGTIVVTCAKEVGDPASVSVSYTIGAATGSSNSYATRTMKNGTNSLTYNVYTNANFTRIWGDGSSPTFLYSGSFSLTSAAPSKNRTHTTFGRAPALQDVAVGTYNDNLLITITF
ncbi:MAG: spore coat protein U domain-containing protein [Aromatoleum sp.]|nr:spore coat protein U domain-containing protein [Aromatoleum sp.]